MSTNDNIIIRSAVLNDADLITALESICSQNPWTRDGILSGLSDPRAIFLVLELTDQNSSKKIIGFVCSLLVLDELQILEVAIHPDYRNRGYGSMLINELLSASGNKNAARGRALLEVRISNSPAISLYEKCGFVRDGIRKGYYQNGEDALLMSRKIY